MAKQRRLEVDLSRLCSAMRSSRRVLEPFRVSRLEAVRKYAGDQWSTETALVPRPVNFLSLYKSVMSHSLLSNSPKVSLSTMNRDYKAVVSAMQSWANPEIERMNLVEPLKRWVIDAIDCVGIMKVGIAKPSESEKSGWRLTVGQPYAEVVDLDDWVMDPHARRLDQLAWCGHRSRLPIMALRDSKLYEAAKRKKIQPTMDRQFNQPGDERIGMLQRQFISGEFEEAYEYVDVWEVYLPMEKVVLVMLSEEGDTPEVTQQSDLLEIRPYVGPDGGPYHFLSLMPPVSGNAMPKGPIQDLIGMDENMNGIFKKLMNQARRQKSILGVKGDADGDAKRIVESNDGEAIRLDHPEKVTPIDFNGPNAGNQQFGMALWDMLNKIGGNIEMLGGLGAQSRTATQDKLLNANSSASVQAMQQNVIEGTAKVMKSLCWYWHHHPQYEMTAYHPIQGLPNPIVRKVSPQQRKRVPFEALELKVDPYSLQYQTPEQKVALLNQIVTTIVVPMMGMLQQQGISFDMNKYLEIIATGANSPELTEIIQSIQVPDGPQGTGSDEGPTKAPTSSRTYNRVNASTASDQGQSKAMQQALLGQNAGGNPSTTKVGR
jgi:hypothetical protein